MTPGLGKLLPELRVPLEALLSDYPRITVTDGFRTREQQAAAYARKPELALPPGRSLHELGLAADLEGGPVGKPGWAEILATYGLRHIKNEPWHVQPIVRAGGD